MYTKQQLQTIVRSECKKKKKLNKANEEVKKQKREREKMKNTTHALQ